MNRRNALRALFVGAPCAGLAIVAGAPALASGLAFVGERGPELVTHPLGHTITVSNGPIRFPHFTRDIVYQMRQQIPAAIEAYNNPLKRGS